MGSLTVGSSAGTVSYMERTRLYYRALGYEHDYVWAHNPDTPFMPLSVPLNASRIAVVTTARPGALAVDKHFADGTDSRSGSSPSRSGALNRRSGSLNRRCGAWSGQVSNPPESLDTDNLAWDKDTTHTNDTETFLPLRALQRLAEAGVIAGLTSRYHGVETEYSQRKTLEVDGPEIVRRVQEDGANAVLLVPL